MKRFISVFFLFLCIVGFPEDSVPEAKLEPVDSFQEPEEKMVGEWLAFVMNRDTPVLISRNRYFFLPSGTWEIRDEAEDAKPEPQGWYKINADERKLLLQPHDASVKGDSAAIHADLLDETRFVIADLLDENRTLTIIKKTSLKIPSKDDLAGTWKITQMDPESGEKRVAPYSLVLNKDGSYAVEQPGKELPEEWAKGTFTISGIRIELKNEFKGTGLWHEPCFFLLDGELHYNDRRYCVWCEKTPGRQSGNETDLKTENTSKTESDPENVRH